MDDRQFFEFAKRQLETALLDGWSGDYDALEELSDSDIESLHEAVAALAQAVSMVRLHRGIE